MSWEQKYLKYKKKYIELEHRQRGGGLDTDNAKLVLPNKLDAVIRSSGLVVSESEKNEIIAALTSVIDSKVGVDITIDDIISGKIVELQKTQLPD